MIPTTIPHGRTAQRLTWPHLPAAVRAAIEERCGAPVVEALSQGTGFTPGFASVLRCADGSRHFVKAASAKAQRMFAESYREEARKLHTLPAAAPAPRLLWEIDADWVVLGIEYVESRTPARPWRQADLDLALDALETCARELTPPPLALDSFEQEFAGWPAYWDHVRATRPDLLHLEDTAELATGYAPITSGDTLVHTDVRDDNTLLTTDGRALFCDWNWPVMGAAWLDTVIMLIGPRGDGLDVEAVLRERALTREVPSEHVDIVLALVCGYFFKAADDPVPPTSPYIREAQRWQGEVVWAWLAERRGW
ncbi:MAG: phosphotransferase family protein [Nocardioides sp.]